MASAWVWDLILKRSQSQESFFSQNSFLRYKKKDGDGAERRDRSPVGQIYLVSDHVCFINSEIKFGSTSGHGWVSFHWTNFLDTTSNCEHKNNHLKATEMNKCRQLLKGKREQQVTLQVFCFFFSWVLFWGQVVLGALRTWIETCEGESRAESGATIGNRKWAEKES